MTTGQAKRRRRARPEQLPRVDRAALLATIAARPTDSSVSLALTDLDGFAELNHRLGRAAGDAVISAWEATLADAVEATDTVARIGGDEYAIVRVNASPETLLVTLDRARIALAEQPDLPAPTTVSIGVAGCPDHAASSEDLWSAATQALMRAKRDGRNRVAVYADEKMVLKSNYYPRGTLERLSKLAAATGRTEASLLREAVDDLFGKHSSAL